eukprot:gene1200-1310_t
MLHLVTCQEKNKQGPWDQVSGAAGDFLRNYKDMHEANTIGADKYFHAKANYEAAQRGGFGKFTAQVFSYGREATDVLRGKSSDWKEDMRANSHGWNGGDPNVYRPRGLPDRY